MQGTFLDNKKRQTTGATLALLAASSFLFVILGLGFCYLVFLMGGSREARNAHDAGTLNAGKSAPLVQISGTGSENEVYGAISESLQPQKHQPSLGALPAHHVKQPLNEHEGSGQPSLHG